MDINNEQKALINELRVESKKLDKWHEKWHEEFFGYINENTETMPMNEMDRRQTIAFKEFSSSELNIYSDVKSLEDNTFFGLSYRIINEIIPKYQEKIKELTKATIRCIALDRVDEAGVCVFSGKPSTGRVLFAKAY